MSKDSDPMGIARTRARAALRSMDAVQDAMLTAAAKADPNNPELTDREFGRMQSAARAKPALVSAAQRGRPRLQHPKEALSIRLDHDVVEVFRATGPDWRDRIRDAIVTEANRLRSVS